MLQNFRCSWSICIIGLIATLLSAFIGTKLLGNTGSELSKAGTNMAAKKLLSVDFEVFGRVQGVFFRKYTKKAAEKYGLVGWCMNTRQDTVKGQVQGDEARIEEMKTWLRTVGSPHSKIDKADFRNAKEIPKLEFTNFSVKH